MTLRLTKHASMPPMGVSGFELTEGQLGLLDADRNERVKKATAAVDRIRDKFGEKSIKLAVGMPGDHAERVHENPVGLPGKVPKPKESV